jgi:hypothetical protein
MFMPLMVSPLLLSTLHYCVCWVGVPAFAVHPAVANITAAVAVEPTVA